MPDPKFGGFATDLDDPASNGFSITPADSGEFANFTRAIYIGGAGNAVIVMANNDVVTLTGLPAGTWLPLRVRRVNATGTTATGIVGFY